MRLLWWSAPHVVDVINLYAHGYNNMAHGVIFTPSPEESWRWRVGGWLIGGRLESIDDDIVINQKVAPRRRKSASPGKETQKVVVEDGQWRPRWWWWWWWSRQREIGKIERGEPSQLTSWRVVLGDNKIKYRKGIIYRLAIMEWFSFDGQTKRERVREREPEAL